MAFKKNTRSLRLDTALGDDVLELVGFRAEEELSQLSFFQLEMISYNAAIAAEDIVGTNVTVTLELDSGGERYFNGYVQRFSALEEDDKGVRNYRATVVPWLWFLTQTTDCRIFQEMSVVDIIAQLFGELGFADFTTSCVFGVNAKRQRNYCVQYRESDFAFVSRLMEEEGLFYFFEHGQGKHTLHLADSVAAYRDCAEAKVHYPSSEQSTHHVVPHITSWEHTYQFRPGAWAHTDYNFKTPGQRLLVTESTLMSFKNSKHFEIFDFPGEFRSRDYGRDLARIRMQELEADHDLVSGSSSCKTFSPGLSFTIGKHRSKVEEGRSYTVQRIVHHATQTDYQTGSNDSTASYNNEFQCFPASMVFRPPRRTPRPSVPGCQTAVVTGPPGENIYTDENERVKIQFFWDRQGKNDEKSSCWIRVSQQWAGEGWGMVNTPHVGQEVVVMFQDGDPDQPLITGRLFNATQRVPIRLPVEKTRTIMRDHGGNQTIMEGAAGKQVICFSQRPSGSS